MNPVFGALSLTHIGVQVNLLPLFLLLMIGVLKTIHGSVMNDFFDIEVDRLSRDPNQRPLVSGDISKKTAIVIALLTILFTFAIFFGYFYRNQPSFYYALFCIIIAAIVGNIYNKYGKRFVGSDFLVGFAEGIFVLIGAYLVSPDGQLSIFTWVIFLLVFNQYLFMNMIIGGMKDADHDFLIKVKNVAIKTGVILTKNKEIHLPISFIIIGLIIRFFTAILVFVPFIFYNVFFELWEITVIILVVGMVILLTFRLLSLKSFVQRKKVLGLFAFQGVLRYSFVPFLLMPLIGLVSTVVLILLPLLWYLLIMIKSSQDIAPNL
ncbi:UbiA family prenyltransferase [Thermoplasmatota archaeon]